MDADGDFLQMERWVAAAWLVNAIIWTTFKMMVLHLCLSK